MRGLGRAWGFGGSLAAVRSIKDLTDKHKMLAGAVWKDEMGLNWKDSRFET